ncbi:inositol monophosphatase family protein [Galbitalea soli]|uniref:Inositol-1-monophosphatase n=1 Tax=Galbitalea soli TaxID=1268042 RepID=A0A7C9PMV2_9MICO|nr:inositol monophosphatase family protein [Galbitalea soli]NEM91051.1 inositol monophosphatase [Galbitalea soli]NYJ29739.1 myo-inositol-1(or 4)-monophosphatase [Galbitalea soli]
MSDELLEIARTVALAAGELVSRRRREGVSIADHKSSPVDVVTLADRESEELIRGLLADARPGDGFFGEEGAAQAGTSGLTWVVDPIDGTVNYLYGIPHYGVSVAVVEGEPDPLSWAALAGCVVNPAIGEVFTASRGGGAFLGDAAIRVAPAVELSQALVATGFSYESAMRAIQGRVVAELVPTVRDIRRGGTASLDLCFVAAGRVNAYYERTLNPWDHAAGALIAVEAGARVTGRDGVPPSKDFILAAEPSVAAALEARLKELGA